MKDPVIDVIRKSIGERVTAWMERYENECKVDEDVLRESMIIQEVMNKVMTGGFELVVDVLKYTPEHWEGRKAVVMLSQAMVSTETIIKERDMAALQITIAAMDDALNFLCDSHNELLMEMIEKGEVDEADCNDETLDCLERHRTAKGGKMVDDLLANDKKDAAQ